MRLFRERLVWSGIAAAVACSACVTATVPDTGVVSNHADAPALIGSNELFGDEFSVEVTVATIKAQGVADRISSRAIRLPERPLGEIAVFGFQFPDSCGGHAFRVYEIDDTQILEYQFGVQGSASRTIRDYVNGTNPFVGPGLWSAYDHTVGSISTMTPEIGQRGDRLLKGAYSKGLVTNLPDNEQRMLGDAYQRALSDVVSCQQLRAVAQVPAER